MFKLNWIQFTIFLQFVLVSYLWFFVMRIGRSYFLFLFTFSRGHTRCHTTSFMLFLPVYFLCRLFRIWIPHYDLLVIAWYKLTIGIRYQTLGDFKWKIRLYALLPRWLHCHCVQSILWHIDLQFAQRIDRRLISVVMNCWWFAKKTCIQ